MIKLGTIAKTTWGTGEDKETVEVIGYADRPTYLVADTDGNQYSWMADLVYSCTPEEAAIYWKNRALAAEGRLSSGNHLPPAFTSPSGWTNQPKDSKEKA